MGLIGGAVDLAVGRLEQVARVVEDLEGVQIIEVHAVDDLVEAHGRMLDQAGSEVYKAAVRNPAKIPNT